MPSLDKLLRRASDRKPQGLDEQIRTLEYITAMFAADGKTPGKGKRVG